MSDRPSDHHDNNLCPIYKDKSDVPCLLIRLSVYSDHVRTCNCSQPMCSTEGNFHSMTSAVIGSDVARVGGSRSFLMRLTISPGKLYANRSGRPFGRRNVRGA